MKASIIRSKLKKKLLLVLDVSCLKGFARTKITTKMWVERCGKKEIERQVRGPGLAYYISPPRDFSNFMEDPLHAFCYILFVPSPQAKKSATFTIYFILWKIVPSVESTYWNWPYFSWQFLHGVIPRITSLNEAPQKDTWYHQGSSLAQYAPNTSLRPQDGWIIGSISGCFRSMFWKFLASTFFHWCILIWPFS